MATVDAVKAIEESFAVHASTIALSKATELFNNQVSTGYNTHYNLKPREKRKCEQYLDNPIYCKSSSVNTSDHSTIQVARDLARLSVEGQVSLPTTVERSLFIGATMREVKTYGNNPALEFYIRGLEDKDMARNMRPLMQLASNILRKAEMPILTGASLDKALSMTMTIDKVLKILAKGSPSSGAERIHSVVPSKQFSILHFQDSLYNMTSTQFLDHFSKTGAYEGHAIMFFPNKFIDPTVPDSYVYNYHERTIFHDIEKFFSDHFRTIWAIMSSIVSAEMTERILEYVMPTLLKMNFDLVKDWVMGIAVSSNPALMIITLLGTILKVDFLVKKAIEALRKYIKKHFVSVYITWKNGFQNGYGHSKRTWEKWLTKGRHYGLGFVVDREVVARFGEMYHLKFSVNTGKEVLVHQISVAEHFKGIEILDFNSSWSAVSRTFGTLNYVSVYKREFFEALEWALGEDIESLDLETVITAVSRLRSGLSINSTELVASWELQDEQVINFSLCVLLETYRLKNIGKSLLNDTEFIVGYKRNIVQILECLGKGLMNLASFGTFGSAVLLYYWLVDGKQNIRIVKDLYKPPLVLEKTAKPMKKACASSNAQSFHPAFPDRKQVTLTFPMLDARKKEKCEWCALCKSGLFGEQELECIASPNELVTWRIEKKAIGDFYNHILNAKTWHESQNASSTVEAIKKAQKFLNIYRDEGIEIKVRAHNIEGGPGSGKSVIAREIANLREKQGYTVAVISPFSELLSDYSNVTLLDNTKRGDFTFKTTWKAFELMNINVLIIEEKGAFDAQIMTLLAAYVGASEVIIIGDEKQTILQESEGISICRKDHPLQRESMTNHRLIYNFRNNPFAVKVLNASKNYKMVSKRTDYKPFRFVTKAYYDMQMQNRNADDKPPFKQISFAEKSIKIFGAEKDKKHTVRSQQGKTHDNVACSAVAADYELVAVHGMLAVAVSRSRDEMWFVVENAEDPTPMRIKTELGIATDEAVQALIDAPWPTFAKVARFEPPSERTMILQKTLLEEAEPKTFEVKQDYDNIAMLCDKIRPVMPKYDLLDDDTYNAYQHCLFVALIEKTGDFFEKEEANNSYRAFLKNQLGLGEKPPPKTPVGACTVEGFLQYCDLVKLRVGIKEYRHHYKSVVTTKKIQFNSLAREFYNSQEDKSKFTGIIMIPVHKTHALCLDDLEDRKYKTIVNDLCDAPQGEYIYRNSANSTLTVAPTIFLPTLGKCLMEVIDLKDKDKIHEILPVLVGGTFKRTKDTVNNDPKQNLYLKRHATNLPTRWILNPDRPIPDLEKLKPLKSRTPKMGKNSFLTPEFIDKSETFKTATTYNQLNIFSSVKGPVKNFKKGSFLIKTGFIFERTKANKIKREKNRATRAFTLGLGNRFNATPVETLIAGSRYLSRKPHKPPSAEGKAHAISITKRFYRENCRNPLAMRIHDRATIQAKCYKDMRDRLYFKRGSAQLKKTVREKMTIAFHNRKIFKPIKDNKLNLLKGGQGIAQTPSMFNFEHIPTMRLINFLYHENLKDGVFYDNLEPLQTFRQKLTRKINKLPACSDTAITDAEEFDANQNWYTVEIEKESRRLQGVSEKYIKSYYRCRDPAVFTCYGKFKGKTNGEKGSGFPDTLLGNSNTSMVTSDLIVRGVGPSVKTGKGDDFGKVQVGIKYDKDFQDELLLYCNLKFKAHIGKGGEFCGDTFSRAGCYPSITRMALKALANRSTSYKQFTEHQIAYRDKIKEIKECGVARTIAANMQAENKTFVQVSAAFSILDSISHLNKNQWLSSTRFYGVDKAILPSATGSLIPPHRKMFVSKLLRK